MPRLLVATGNPGKLIELRALLAELAGRTGESQTNWASTWMCQRTAPRM